MTHLVERHPADIKADLEKAGLTITGLATELKMDRRHVSVIIHKAAIVYAAIAEKIKHETIEDNQGGAGSDQS